MNTKRILFFLLLLGLIQGLWAQRDPLFDNDDLLSLVDLGGDYIYNEQFDSAALIIDRISKKLPDHPIVPMMRAFSISWQDQPIRTSSKYYPSHVMELEKALVLAEKKLEKNPKDLEGMFFKMSVHGLLAEYLASEGNYLKAVSQAQRTYALIKETMEKTDESNEFFFLAGLYNYFRETYPERHPVYKPLMWFFKSGDRERGLVQLDSAVRFSKIVKIEANLYLSYIYLRYENRPDRASSYLKLLVNQYPRNKYFKAKLIESLILEGRYSDALPYINWVLGSENSYYLLCGHTFSGIYYELYKHDNQKAETNYLKAIEAGKQCIDRGEYYKSLAFLGLGRLQEAKNKKQLAAEYYNKAIETDESPRVTSEARERLSRLNL